MTEPIKYRILADKLDEIDRVEVLQSVVNDLAASISQPLSPDEIRIFDYLRFNSGSTETFNLRLLQDL